MTQKKGKLNPISPQIRSASGKTMAREALKEELAKTGGTLSDGMYKQADGGGVFFSIPMPFQPEFGDPSKLHYPVDRHQQNRYWRLYYKTDPVVGSVIDMFAEMLCSDIDIYGEGITGDIKRAYEDMIQSTQIVSLFQYFIKEFLVIGEVIPHLIFDETKGIWTDLLFHNPDQVNILSSPFMNMEPIVEFTPDESLRSFTKSRNPQILEYLSTLPPDVLGSIMSGSNIPLNTKMNVSFLPRKLHPYDVRGTSILPRLWQILMYEQSVSNAAIATARRHAGPIKVLKVGQKDGTWLPDQNDLDALLEKLTLAEQDPHAWLTTHPFLEFEAWGTTDRMMSISREYDLIERVKLTALGVSQGFLHGEATYASSTANFNTLLMRLRGLRKFFEGTWWFPKFFKPIAEINQWTKSSQAEVSHRVRVKKEASQERLIIPKIKWRQTLEPVVDKDMLDAIRALQDMGIRTSKSTAFAAAGLDFEGETTSAFVEQKIEKAIRKKVLPEEKEEQEKIEEEISAPGGGGLPMAPMEEDETTFTEESQPSPSEAEFGETGPSTEEGGEGTGLETAPASKRGFKVTANDIEDLIDLLESGKTDSNMWAYIINKDETPSEFIKECDWDRILDYMEDEGYSNNEIEYTRKALVRKNVIDAELRDQIEQAVETLNMAAATDDKLHEKLDGVIGDSLNKKIAKFVNKTNEKTKETYEDIDSYLAGEGNYTYSTNNFVVTSGGDMSKNKIANFRRKKTKARNKKKKED